MNIRDLTLIIPAKFEAESLPSVLNELKNFKCEKKIILESSDIETINSIKKFNCDIIYQQKKGYGDALITGIENVKTKYLCIFNADGSFDPKYLHSMLSNCENLDFVFASRYLKDGGSEDDTFVTRLGNFFFSTLGNFLYSLNISDILYTYILGKTNSFRSLNLKCNDFCLCVEIPINARKKKKKYLDIPSKERRRIAGFKKVSEFKDGFKILSYMLKKLFI
jgi:glycosyltransferase involved in cell wall biosynthesis|tara:strand:- start:910 stop:1575 length:666 start_codon:yes stop_codon:yes gene_type:complete